MSLVSIIVPVFNSEATISKCLDSIINQSYQKIEIIIVNDCSTDNTSLIYKNYKERDSRILVVENETNKGVSFSRNKGIEISSGEYICFVDADDYVDKNYVKILFNLSQNNECELVFAGLKKIYKKSSQKEYSGLNEVIIDNDRSKRDLMELIYSNDLSRYKFKNTSFLGYSVAKLYKKTLLETNNIRFSTRYTIREDALFNFNCIYHSKKVVISDSIIYNYIIGDNSATSSFKKDYTSEVKHYLFELKKEFRIKNLNLESYNISVFYFYLMWCRLYSLNRNSEFTFREKKQILKESFYASYWSCPINHINSISLPMRHRLFLLAYKYKSANVVLLLDMCNDFLRSMKGIYHEFKN